MTTPVVANLMVPRTWSVPARSNPSLIDPRKSKSVCLPVWSWKIRRFSPDFSSEIRSTCAFTVRSRSESEPEAMRRLPTNAVHVGNRPRIQFYPHVNITRVKYLSGSLAAHHPTFCPLFCSSSHFCKGAKYSSRAPPSICRVPVRASSASGQGLLWPIANIALNVVPASFEP